MRRLPFALGLVAEVYAGRKTQTRRPARAPLLGVVGDELLVAEPLVPVEVGSALVAAYAVDRELVRGARPELRPGKGTCPRCGMCLVCAKWCHALVGELLPWKNPACRFIAASYMPGAAGRRCVRLLEVRLQGVAAISEEEARAEGVEPIAGSHATAFLRLWDRLYPGELDAHAYRFELSPPQPERSKGGV